MAESSTKVNPGEKPSALDIILDKIGFKYWPIYKMAFGGFDTATLVTALSRLPVDAGLRETAFNELSVAQLTPITNVEFVYNLHADIVTTRLNNGSASVDSDRMKLSTGAGANQSAQLFTNVPIKHYAGLGTVIRFTAIYDVGTVGSNQIVGIGDSGDGLFAGYNGTDYGFLRRKGGVPEIRSLQVTTKSTTAENITIELDGDSDATVAVTDATAGDVTTTVNEIATHDYSNLGRGWKAVANGDTVNFISFDASPRIGTYSYTATTMVGSYSQKLAGVSPTDTWTKQTLRSGDRFLASTDEANSPGGVTLNQQTGNVFAIVFGWLGFDGLDLFIKSPTTRKWVLSHSVEYANANTTPFINNPTLPICAMIENTTNDTDLSLYSSSAGGFVEGKVPDPVVKHTAILNKTFSSTTIVPAITLHNNGVFQSKLNRVRARITNISVEVESGKPVIIEVIKDAVIEDSTSFSNHDSDTSVIATDTSAIAVAGGEIVKALPVRAAGDKDRDLDVYVDPTKFVTIAGAQTSMGTASVCKIIIEWVEDF